MMSSITRRNLLKLATVAPVLPNFLVRSAQALDNETASTYDGNILIVVRMIGGNDGLNAVVLVRDDAYFKGRPTIAIKAKDTLPLAGGNLGLNPALADFRWLMDAGHASIIQNVGYPNPSRSHIRATEIFETGSIANDAPHAGWLGRYLDEAEQPGRIAGLEFGDGLGRTLLSNSNRSRSITNAERLLKLDTSKLASGKPNAAAGMSLGKLRLVESELRETSLQLLRASKGSGAKYAYPDSSFGQNLRWVGNMVESRCPTRLFYVTLGSFDSGYSFDTHSEELGAHDYLYSELGKGFRALATHLQASGQLNRVQLLTFSDFGRQVAENREGGTDHGDAGLVFTMGGKVLPGMHGVAPDIAGAHDGGLPVKVDFREIYANVLESWLKMDSQKILGEKVAPYKVIA